MSELVLNGINFDSQLIYQSPKSKEGVSSGGLAWLNTNKLKDVTNSEDLFECIEPVQPAIITDQINLQIQAKKKIGTNYPAQAGEYEISLSFTTQQELDSVTVYIDFLNYKQKRERIGEYALSGFQESARGSRTHKIATLTATLDVKNEYIFNGVATFVAYVIGTDISQYYLSSELTFDIVETPPDEPDDPQVVKDKIMTGLINYGKKDLVGDSSLEGDDNILREIALNIQDVPMDLEPFFATDLTIPADNSNLSYEEDYKSEETCKKNVLKFLEDSENNIEITKEIKEIVNKSLDSLLKKEMTRYSHSNSLGSYEYVCSEYIKYNDYLTERDDKFVMVFWAEKTDQEKYNDRLQYTSATFTITYEKENSSEEGCLRTDTLITMANGTFQTLDSLKAGDLVMSENHFPTKVCNVQIGDYEDHYNEYIFDNSIVINEVHDHRFFNVEQGFWQRLKHWKIGEHALTSNGEKVQLTSIRKVNEKARWCDVRTESGMFYANGLLTGAAFLNRPILEEASIDQAVDMMLSFNQPQLLGLINKGGILP